MDIVMELMGILSMINISIPCIGLKKNHYGSVILSLMGGYGLKNIYVPLFPYTYTIGVFSSCEIEEKKTPNKLNLEEYIKVYQLIDDIYSGKIIPTDENLKKILGGKYLEYELDFNQIPIDTLVQNI